MSIHDRTPFNPTTCPFPGLGFAGRASSPRRFSLGSAGPETRNLGVGHSAGPEALALPGSKHAEAKEESSSKIDSRIPNGLRRCGVVISALFLWPIFASASEVQQNKGWFRGAELTWNPQAQASDTRPTYHALVIGINAYKAFSNGSGWEPLLTSRPDAEAVAELLAEEYGFEVQTLVDREATRSNIMKVFDKIIHLTLNDAMLVYFSGHGFYDQNLGEGFWIPQDARREDDGRPATDEWLWNSTLTKIIGASQARHVFVVADSCYGGSLFRGAEHIINRHRFRWYRRANARPSRYLLTSGNLEPVLDTGARHSIFAQQLLNYLTYPEQDVFSATDLGKALRTKVSALTGQMVRMGPLKVSSHAGGEFVFMRDGADFPSNLSTPPESEKLPKNARETFPNDEAPSYSNRTDQEILQDAVLLKRRGASNSAEAILSRLQSESSGTDGMVNLVARYIQPEKEQHRYDQLEALIDRLEANKHALEDPDWLDPTVARPRILVCTGPVSSSHTTEDASLAMLYRVCLYDALQGHPGTRVVDREVFEEVVREMNVGTSILSDRKARLAVGKLLPASLILFGYILSSEQGVRLYLRLVDTETTQVVDTFLTDPENGKPIVDVCRDAAQKITERAKEFRPLTVRVEDVQEGMIRAGIGAFHGVQKGMEFILLERDYHAPTHPLKYSEREVGTAKITQLGEWASTFRPSWSGPNKPDEQAVLWIRE